MSSIKLEITEARNLVKTDKLQLSVGELINMYDNGELNIQPDFQRLFRWTAEKKSNLIESILIDIPIPPVFAYEDEDGNWELVDGLQRVSTIFEFFGVLKRPDSDEVLPPSALLATTYIPSLENAVWEKSEEIKTPLDEQNPLDRPQQLAIRRARLDVHVLKQPSDAETKFHLFQRLNRGGAFANEQEVRTCAMVMIEPEKVKIIKRLAMNEKFREMTSLKVDAVKRQKDIEYVVRSLIHTYRDYDNKSDVEEFLDSQIVDLLPEVDMADFEVEFVFVVDALYELFGTKALFPSAGTKPGAGLRFSLRSLEAVFVGLLINYEEITALANPKKFINDSVLSFWKNKTKVDAMSASGLRGTQRLQRTVPFGATHFAPN